MCLPIGIRCSSWSPVVGSRDQQLAAAALRCRRTPRGRRSWRSPPRPSGWRASNSSATRGRPPVMSLVRRLLRGVFASMAPASTSSPFVHHHVRAGRNACRSPAPRSVSRPCRMICGCRSSLCSSTTVPSRPVASSTSFWTVTPSMKSWKSIDARPAPPGSARCTGSHFDEALALLDRAAVRDRQITAPMTVRVALEFAPVLVVDADHAVLVQHDVVAVQRPAPRAGRGTAPCRRAWR